jgi:NNP family nitrate/nitrite transporter-like MFS transporter
MRDVTRQPHIWIMSLLSIGTFGLLIGFGFAFGQVLHVQFADIFDTPVKAAYLTFLGPLLGSLIRPVGGSLPDRLGGARVTFVAMAAGASIVLLASKQHSLPLYLVGFIAPFVFSGSGNGSTYKMIPAIFRAKCGVHVTPDGTVDPHDRAAEHEARRLSGALIGIAGAIGAFGGVLVSLAFRQSFLVHKTADAAYLAFIAFYAVCFVVTWVVCLRPSPSRR